MDANAEDAELIVENYGPKSSFGCVIYLFFIYTIFKEEYTIIYNSQSTLWSSIKYYIHI